MNKIKLLSLFSGIGAFEKALGDRCELVNYCEIDKYASKAFSLIHGVSEDLNLKDVTKINTSLLPCDIDLITYGFPCQDISQAGKQKGFTDENGNTTRSGLFFEALRIIENLKPKYAIAENVKALTGKKFKNEFETVISSLEDAGYNNYFKVLNAKDYGIPQNRERVFIISIRKDIDDGSFEFPEPRLLDKRLKDILEENVDEKFYLKETRDFFIKNSLNMEAKGNGFRFAPHVKNHAEIAKTITTRAGGRMDDNFIMDNEIDSPNFVFNSENVKKLNEPTTERMSKQAYETLQENECKDGDVINPFNKRVVNDGICPTITTRPEGFKTANLIVTEPKVQQIKGNLYPNSGNPQAGRVYNTTGISPALDTCQGGNRMPKIVCEQRSDEGLRFFKDGVCGTLRTIDACEDKRVLEPTATAEAMRGRQNGQQLEILNREYSNALTSVQKDSLVNCDFRIRKLTPTECWRLMGFADSDIQKCIDAGISNAQLYKMAGNSIVTTVLKAIFEKLFKD